MQTQYEYILLTAVDPQALARLVNARLAEGWRLHGATQGTTAIEKTAWGTFSQVQYAQAMTREVPDD